MGKWKGKIRRQQKVCQVCGCSDPNKLTVHHVLARSLNPEIKGDDRNLVLLCHNCHNYLHDVIQPLRGLEHNECDFYSLIMLFVHKGNKKRWNKRKYMHDVLNKAKTGYYETHDI